MGLKQALARHAVASAHVLLVELPGHWHERVAVEREVLRRGWRLALSPADADLLVVCGPRDERFGEIVERLWNQMPGPRARVDLTSPEAVVAELDAAGTRLEDDPEQRADARLRVADLPDEGAGHGGGHEGMDHGGMDHGGMDHGDMDHGDMDHGDMDMSPGGIPLAQGGRDRDGLEMDELHVPLGPVLPYWPAGLVLTCALQGDVVVDAEVDVLRGPGEAASSAASSGGPVRAARLVDAARDVLGVADWEDAAAAAAVVRDSLLLADDPRAAAEGLQRLRRRVSRSWLLRWQLSRLGHLGAEQLAEHRLPAVYAGDVHDRLLRLLEEAAAAVEGRVPDPSPAHREAEALLDALPALVVGLDLAAVRLVVASTALEVTASPRTSVPVATD